MPVEVKFMTPLILGPFLPKSRGIKRHQDDGDAHHPRPLRGYDVPSASIVKTKQRSFAYAFYTTNNNIPEC